MANQPLHLLKQLWKLWKGLDEVAKTAETSTLSEEVVLAKGTKMVKINQWVRIGAYEIKVNAIEDRTLENHKLSLKRGKDKPPILVLEDGTEMMPPMDKEQPQFLFVDVSYRNPAIGENLDCRRNQWWLYDADGYSYEALYTERLYKENDKRYLGGSRYLLPGTNLRGWIAFELPQTAVSQRLQFVDGFLRGNVVDFNLSDSRQS